ncbi:MAG: hypothetical protein KGJ43_07630 [Acidobacteriota bacterium]|nr:hypothetical protein [Acidobacteriota bacterium]
MADELLKKVQSEIHARLRELEGARAEYDQLLAAAELLGGSTSAGRARRSSAGKGARSARGRARRRAVRRAAVTEPAAGAPETVATKPAARGGRRRATAARRPSTRARATAKPATAKPATAKPATARTPARRAPARVRAGSRKRAPRGANRDAVLAVLRASSTGMSAREVAIGSGVGRVSTYQVLGRLEGEKLVRHKDRKDGPALYSAV